MAHRRTEAKAYWSGNRSALV